jgi:Fe-S oxidoreductase
MLKSKRFSQVCPAVARYNFHTYSGSGRLEMALSLHLGRIKEWTDEMVDILYRCQMCGACEVSCRTNNFLGDLGRIIDELRFKAIEDGAIVPEHMLLLEGMKREDNPFGLPKSDRGRWAEGLEVKDLNKEKAEVIFHAGCRFSYDEDLRDTVRGAVDLLTKAGVDVGIYGEGEACCGGRAYEIGYQGEMLNYADDMASRVKASGATTLVTPCSDCYGTFNQLYALAGRGLEGVEVLHITEYLDRLIAEGKLEAAKEIDIKVTYHDPCHLGRKGEHVEPWDGEWRLVAPHVYVPEPAKPLKAGIGGCYEPPRQVLRSIPGLELVEMERIKSYAWCCGAGGGVYEAYPDFAYWAALERIEEAKASGAEALATACPWCVRNFRDALAEEGDDYPVYDVVQLLLGEV